MNILVVDIGGTNVKCLASGQRVPRKFPSGPQLTPKKMEKGTVEDYVGALGLKRLGRKKWEKHVMLGIERLMSALLVDDVVIGGGNAKKLRVLPAGCRLGSNANAFVGGFRIWQEAGEWESSNVLVTRVGRGGEVEPAQQMPVTH